MIAIIIIAIVVLIIYISKKRGYKINLNSEAVGLLILTIMFGLGTYLIFAQALPDVEHQPHGPIPVFMGGLLMLGITLGLSFATYDQINPIRDYRKFEKLSTRISIIIGLLFSVFSLCIGDVVSKENKEKIKGYEEIKATYVGFEEVSSGGYDSYDNEYSSSTHVLKYVYEVDGKKYTVCTDFETSIKPEIGTQKTILYNPSNPSEAIVEVQAEANLFKWLGIAFTVIIIIVGLENATGILKKIKEMMLLLFLTVAGGGVYYIMGIGGDEFSLITPFKTSGIFAIIPLMLFLVGVLGILTDIYTTIKNKINERKEHIK